MAYGNVIAYQVVIADGRIITADKDDHSDLFRIIPLFRYLSRKLSCLVPR